MTLKIANQSFCMTFQLMTMHHYTKFGNKMFGGVENNMWTNSEILTLRCDLDLERSKPFFFLTRYSGLWLSDQVWLRISTSEDTVERVIFWSYKPLLWAWPWWQHRLTDILNLCCDLDLERSNPIFPHDTLAYAVLSNQVWLQTDNHFRRQSRKSHFDNTSPCCDLHTENSEPIFFLHDTPSHDNTPPNHVG